MNASNTMTETKMGNELVPISKNGKLKARAVFTPHVDIVEAPDALTLFADMPGVETEDLDIRVHESELAIAGTVRQRSEPTKWLAKEYEIGGFYRSFQISDDIDATDISAELKNGELRVHLPKVERAKPIKIEVKAG